MVTEEQTARNWETRTASGTLGQPQTGRQQGILVYVNLLDPLAVQMRFTTAAVGIVRKCYSD